MAKFLQGRTDNSIKNHWNSSMKKKIQELNEKYNSIKTSGGMDNKEQWNTFQPNEQEILEKLLNNGNKKDFHELYGLSNETQKIRRQFKRQQGSAQEENCQPSNIKEPITEKSQILSLYNQSPNQFNKTLLNDLEHYLSNSNNNSQRQLLQEISITLENTDFKEYVDQYSMDDVHNQTKHDFNENNLATFAQIFNVNKLNSFLQGNPKFANKYLVSGQKEKQFKLSTSKSTLVYTNSPDVRHTNSNSINNYLSEKTNNKQKKNTLILQKLQESQRKQDLEEEQQLLLQQQQQQKQNSSQKIINSKRKQKKNQQSNVNKNQEMSKFHNGKKNEVHSYNMNQQQQLQQHNYNSRYDSMSKNLSSSAEPSQMFTSPKKINKILYDNSNNQMSGEYINNSEFSFEKFQYSSSSNAYVYDTPPIKNYNNSIKYEDDRHDVGSKRVLMKQKNISEGEPQQQKKIKKNSSGCKQGEEQQQCCDMYEGNELINEYKYNVSDQKENGYHNISNNHLQVPNNNNANLMFNLMSKFESPSRLLNLCNTPDKFLNHGYGGANNHYNGFKLVNQFQYEYQKSPLLLKTPYSIKKEKF